MVWVSKPDTSVLYKDIPLGAKHLFTFTKQGNLSPDSGMLPVELTQGEAQLVTQYFYEVGKGDTLLYVFYQHNESGVHETYTTQDVVFVMEVLRHWLIDKNRIDLAYSDFTFTFTTDGWNRLFYLLGTELLEPIVRVCKKEFGMSRQDLRNSIFTEVDVAPQSSTLN